MEHSTTVSALIESIQNTPFHFKIGDPSLLGWLTVGLYLICLTLCCLNLLQSLQATTNRPLLIWFWGGIAILMLFMGFNKQLDLQSWFTAVGRHLATSQGWYADRRLFQAIFVLVFTALACGVGTFVLFAFRRVLRQNLLALAGILTLSVFVLVQAASFHHVSFFPKGHLTRMLVHCVLEVGGILLICTAAALNLLNSWRNSKL